MTTRTEIKEQITPLPWRVNILPEDRFRDIFISTPRDESRLPFYDNVCEVWTKNGMPYETAKANAEYLCRAANSFPALLAALEDLVYACDGNYAELTAQARAAIAAAKAP